MESNNSDQPAGGVNVAGVDAFPTNPISKFPVRAALPKETAGVPAVEPLFFTALCRTAPLPVRVIPDTLRIDTIAPVAASPAQLKVHV